METPADQIETFLAAWKHEVWGFVIYRCTYTSDNDFIAFISHIKNLTLENLEIYGADVRLLAQQLSWKVVEDRESLEGASKADVRRSFDEWCQSPEAAAEHPESSHTVAESQNARYRFCMHVDLASLDSFTGSRQPWVNLILRRWPYDADLHDEDDDEDENDGDDEGLDEIEGSTAEDVGWCKIAISGLLPDTFAHLCHPNAWYRVYQRPPAVVGRSSKHKSRLQLRSRPRWERTVPTISLPGSTRARIC